MDGISSIKNKQKLTMRTLKKTINLTSVIISMLILACVPIAAQTINGAKNGIAFQEQEKFGGWPANNGLWTWDNGKEILAGYTYGPFVEQKGHNVLCMSEFCEDLGNRLARSTDGGLTWKSEVPGNYAGTTKQPVPSPGGIDFQSPGFAMRVVAYGYHGSHDTVGGHFFVSDNRGKQWNGPYQFNGLKDDHNLKGFYNTARTEYCNYDLETKKIVT